MMRMEKLHLMQILLGVLTLDGKMMDNMLMMRTSQLEMTIRSFLTMSSDNSIDYDMLFRMT